MRTNKGKVAQQAFKGTTQMSLNTVSVNFQVCRWLYPYKSQYQYEYSPHYFLSKSCDTS